MLVAELLQIQRSVCLEPEWELAGRRRTKNNWLHVRKLRGSSNTVEDTCNEEGAVHEEIIHAARSITPRQRYMYKETKRKGESNTKVLHAQSRKQVKPNNARKKVIYL